MMINTDELVPQYIEKIYETILKGHFINENSHKNGFSELYSVIDNQEVLIREYFRPIGYILMRGAGYFYFAHEKASDSQGALELIVDYIEITNFLKTLDSNFGVSYRFRLDSMESILNSSIELQDLASKMRGISAKDNREFIFKVVDKLRKNGFVEEQDSQKSEFLVLNSFEYIELFLREVEIYE